MNTPTYEELSAEIEKLKAKLSFGEDKEFTEEVRALLPPARSLYQKSGKITMRPGALWELLFPTEPSTRDLAKLGRSLQALGWARSAQHGNLVFTLPVEEYAK